MYDCIIFDVDGTMIDTESAVFDTYQKLIHEEFGRYFKPEEIRPVYGVPTHEALEKLGFKDVEEGVRRHHDYLMEAFRQVTPFPGIPDVLERLRRSGKIIGVVTSRNDGEVKHDACLQSMAKYFHYIVCADDTQKHKPDAEPLLKAMEKAGCDAGRVLYIGDTHYDSKCAENVVVTFALACWGAGKTEEIRADHILKTPEDILQML